MGLNATVYCDCVEMGRIRTPHPFPHLLFVDETGCPNIRSTDEKQIALHDQWWINNPCIHETSALVSHRLGNISGIAWVRDALFQRFAEPARDVPVLWNRVVYTGIHTGDRIEPYPDAERLGEELKRCLALDWNGLTDIDPRQKGETARRVPASPENIAYVRELFRMLGELAAASLQVGKPISF